MERHEKGGEIGSRLPTSIAKQFRKLRLYFLLDAPEDSKERLLVLKDELKRQLGARTLLFDVAQVELLTLKAAQKHLNISIERLG